MYEDDPDLVIQITMFNPWQTVQLLSKSKENILYIYIYNKIIHGFHHNINPWTRVIHNLLYYLQSVSKFELEGETPGSLSN